MALPIFLSKDSVFRITNREAVHAGTKYISCLCKSCQQPMYLFTVPSDAFSGPFIGDGKVSVPCRHCKHDDIYDAWDFTFRTADIDLSPTYEPRVQPSDMPRQPILRTKYSNAKPTFGPHSLEDRPKAAALIARIIGLSSEIDAAFAFLLGRMMRANTPPAMALFLSLRQSRVQNDALNAVATAALPNEQDHELFGALMSLRSGADNERDALAHGRFGESPAITDGVVWVDAFDFLQYSLRTEAEGYSEQAMQWLRERMYVYELADLERIAQAAEALYDSVRSFAGYLWSDDAAWRAARYPQLCAEPHVQQAPYQLREGARKKTEAQPEPK